MANSEDTGQLDHYDQKILEQLSVDGRMSVTDLANKLGLSKTPCGVRLKRLINDAYILGFRAVLNPRKLDLNQVAFVEVKLRDTTESALIAFNEAVDKIPDIEQCHLIAGPFDYLIKVRTKDIMTYRQILAEQISTLPNVASTSTYMAMETVKEQGV